MDSQRMFWRFSLEGRYALLTFFVGVFLVISISVFATDIGTNITSSGSLFASSSLDVTGNATFHTGVAIRAGAGAATTTAGGLVAENADIARMQIGTGSVVSKMQFGTCSINPPVLKAGTGTTTTCTATGVTTSDKVWMTAPGLPQTNDLGSSTGNLVFVAASSTAADTITVQILNTSTSTAVDAAAATWAWMGLR